jgi:NADH-quinone oxidoreductase subunit J
MTALGTIYFWACAVMAIAGALAVVVSKNPIRGAMGLLLLILSIAGLFLALHAQFLAAIQLIVYAGAIVILFLFVIMILGPSAATPRDRRGLATRAFSGGLFGIASLTAISLLVGEWVQNQRILPLPEPDATFGGIDAFGSVLFADALVPFEVSSALLMVAVVGAIAVARGRQGVESMSRGEKEVARTSVPSVPSAPAPGQGHGTSGVYSHEIHAHDPGPAKEPSA